MSEKQTTTYNCDLCGREIDNKYRGIPVLSAFTTEQTEGRPIEPELHIAKLDVCRTCLTKLTRLKGSGAMGYNRYEFLKPDNKWKPFGHDVHPAPKEPPEYVEE
jgi:hypothetical protein